MTEAYIDGTLPPAERQAFEAQMAADPALRAEVEAYRDMVNRLDGLRRREKVQANLAPAPALRVWWLALLLVGLTGVVATVWGVRHWKREQEVPAVQPSESITPQAADSIPVLQPPAEKNTAPKAQDQVRPKAADAPPIAATEPLEADAALLAACDAALMRIDPFEAALRSSETTDQQAAQLLNRALALLKSHRPDAALTSLNQLTTLPERYLPDREWLEALAQTMKKPTQGKVLMKRISDDAGHAYRLDAAKILLK
jgi:hypothetical protein